MASKPGVKLANGLSGKVGSSLRRDNGAPVPDTHGAAGLNGHTNGNGVNGKVNGTNGVKA